MGCTTAISICLHLRLMSEFLTQDHWKKDERIVLQSWRNASSIHLMCVKNRKAYSIKKNVGVKNHKAYSIKKATLQFNSHLFCLLKNNVNFNCKELRCNCCKFLSFLYLVRQGRFHPLMKK